MSSKLIHKGTHEVQDELEITLSQAYSTLQAQLSSPYHISSASAAQRGPLTQALLYAVLIQPQGASSTSYINHLTTITTDGYASFVGFLHRLVSDSYPKLLDQPRSQVIWLLKQLIGLYAADVDNLCLLLLRQIVGGDLSANNVWLATQILDVINNNMSWVTGNHAVLTSALYTYLRLLPDHNMAKSSAVNELRQAEIKFCVFVLREHFQECFVIGRDLVRLLQDVSSIPEFEAIWRDLLSNPAIFKAPSFTDLAQLYAVRTPPRYIQSRLTPDMETQIKFMLTHVRMGNQRRYQTWFSQRFLSTPESESLVCDLIRYVCCVHHPSNQILQSDILPRWALIGWLLKCCKSNHIEANAKLALLYDWLFFVPKTDNIMNIEPAILVMVHSIPKYADMTNALLEFLFLLMEHYDPTRKELLQRGIGASVDILVGKGVVRSLEPLSAALSVAAPLREKLSQNFPSYCKLDGLDNSGFKLRPKQESPGVQGKYAGSSDGGEGSTDSGSRAQSSEDKDFGQQEGAPPENTSIRKRRRSVVHDELQSHVEKLSKALGSSQDAAIKVLEDSLVTLTTQERAEKFASQITEVLKRGAYELFSPLPSTPTTKPEGDERMSISSSMFRFYVHSGFPHVKSMLMFWHREGFPVGPRLLCYCSRLAEELETKDLLNSRESEAILAKAEPGSLLSESSEEDGDPRATEADQKKAGKLPANKRLQRHGSSVRQKSLHKTCHTLVADAFKAYEEFQRAVVQLQSSNASADASNANLEDEVKAGLLSDLQTCLVWNVCRLQRVLPSVYRFLSSLAVGNEKLMQLTVSILAPADILNFELRLALGEFSVIGDLEKAVKLIKASLAWDSIEQHYFWKLLIAEVQGCGALTSLEVLKACPSLVNPETDVEAMSGVLSLLRSSTPTARLSSALLSSPQAFEKLAVAVFTNWFFAFFQALVSSLNQLSAEQSKDVKGEEQVNRLISRNGGTGGGGGVEKLNWPTLDALLNHLDEFDVTRNMEETRTKEAAEIRQSLLRLAAFCHDDCSDIA